MKTEARKNYTWAWAALWSIDIFQCSSTYNKKKNGTKSIHKAAQSQFDDINVRFIIASYNCAKRIDSNEGKGDVDHRRHHHHRCLLPIKLHFIFEKRKKSPYRKVSMEKIKWSHSSLAHFSSSSALFDRKSNADTPTHRLASPPPLYRAAGHIQQSVVFVSGVVVCHRPLYVCSL